jgi:hypothetical protein
MAIATVLGTNTRTAVQVPRWACAFYLRHLPLVAGISLLPASERFVSQLWGTDLPAGVTTSLEVIAEGARLVLIAVVVRLAILADDRLRPLRAAHALARVKAFARARWPSLAVQCLLLAAAVVAFDLIPERVVAPRIPEHTQPLYWAVLLAAKNLTVIALTMIWLVGAVRQMLLSPPSRPRVTEPSRT